MALALSYSDQKFVDGRLDHHCSQMRQLDMLVQGELDYMWAGTTQKLEQSLIPIRIPVYKGLMGHRIFLMKQPMVEKLAAVKTLDDLKKFNFGQGEEWADTAILKASGFNVVTGTRYNNMFDMLVLGRYQLFPRAVHEIWKEESTWKEKGVLVDDTLMLVYPMPAYIFVSPKKPELAALIRMGLMRSIEDGSFDRLFYENTQVKTTLQKADFSRRKVFYLENPYLSAETPLSDKRLWLDTMAFFAGNTAGQ